ncbi:ribonuclease H-like domain-containing protein, partial [Tanacetum coccineum]
VIYKKNIKAMLTVDAQVPRKNNMYSVDMKNIVPKESLTCLIAKATLDESMLWHRRLCHINFKTINKLVKDNLVRGLPIKHFENDQTCVACLKGKQHKASCINREFSVARTLQQNDVAERRNRTLIKAARTMLVDSKLPTTFWTEAVNTACYVQNMNASTDEHPTFYNAERKDDKGRAQEVWTLVDLPYGKRAIGTKWVYKNKKDERGQIDKTLFIKRVKGDILLVQVYVDDIIFGSTKKEMCTEFEKIMHKRFPSHTLKGSHLYAVKRIFRYLKGQPKLGLWYLKDSPFDLESYTHSDYAGAGLDKKSTIRVVNFLDSIMISGNARSNYSCPLLLLFQYLIAKVFNDDYVAPSHTKKVFAYIRREGKGFLGTITPLFPSMLVTQAVEGEGSGQPFEPQHTPTTASLSNIEPIPNVSSSSQPPKTHKSDETVHEERGDSVEMATTTTASLDAAHDSGNILRT